MQLYKRENYLSKIRGFYHANDLIKVLTGVRRCGKSSMMQLIVDELRAEGVPEENIVFIDLEKRGFRSIRTAERLDEVLEEALSVEGDKYLFLDEVQHVSGFEEVLDSFRAEGNCSIFVSSSVACCKTDEITTALTGRYIEFEIFPLSFGEYLEMKEFCGMGVEADLHEELSSYFDEGGFPGALYLTDINDKKRYVAETVSEVFRKDISRRMKIRHRDTFALMTEHIIGNYGKPTNVSRIVDGLKAEGISVSRATVTRYLEALTDAKIIYPCERFDVKSRKMLTGEKKYYLADPSLLHVFDPDSHIDYGRALENLVYIYARSRDYSVSVGRTGKLECDFVLRDIELDYSYVQVASTIQDSRTTEEREYRPLEMIRDNWSKYMLTTDHLLQKRNGIRHENLMEFIKEGRLF